MMNLRFEYIAYFVCVAKSGSFSAAARKLKKSQSTISIAIQNLEAELGFDLFERTGSGISLTRKGERFYHTSSPLITKYRNLTDISVRLSETNKLSYRIGVDPIMYPGRVKYSVTCFPDAFPDIELKVTMKPTAELSEDLENGKLDMVIGNPYVVTGPSHEVTDLFQFNCWWVCHKDFALDDEEAVRVLLIEGSQDIFSLATISSLDLWQLHDFCTILSMCREKKGIAFVPEVFVDETYCFRKLKVVHNHQKFFGKSLHAALFWRKNTELKVLVEWFKQQLRHDASKKEEVLC